MASKNTAVQTALGILTKAIDQSTILPEDEAEVTKELLDLANLVKFFDEEAKKVKTNAERTVEQ